jgi:ABC-2 type transport system ATP-binding protein
METPVIEAEGLTKQYPHCLALDRATFRIDKGEIVGLVGKNGAGKTTLIRLITGIAIPTSGTFSILGESDPQKLVALRRSIAAMVETPALYLNLNARDNLMTRCILMGIKNPLKSGYVHDTLEYVGLHGAFADPRIVKNYSLGMRQRLGIAMALVGEPKLLILDEPTNGLDPEGIKQIRELLMKLNKEKGITMIVSSHILAELSKFATSYIFIDRGRLIEHISAEELEHRTGKVLILKTSDNAKALSLLLAASYQADIIGDSVYVHNLREGAPVLNLLSNAAVPLLGMREESNDLEDYFVKLVGGTANV